LHCLAGAWCAEWHSQLSLMGSSCCSCWQGARACLLWGVAGVAVVAVCPSRASLLPWRQQSTAVLSCWVRAACSVSMYNEHSVVLKWDYMSKHQKSNRISVVSAGGCLGAASLSRHVRGMVAWVACSAATPAAYRFCELAA
jgi:hypothetical protein